MDIVYIYNWSSNNGLELFNPFTVTVLTIIFPKTGAALKKRKAHYWSLNFCDSLDGREKKISCFPDDVKNSAPNNYGHHFD